MTRWLNKKYLFLLVLTVVSTTSLFIRFFQSLNYDFPFTYDQALTAIDTRVLAYFYDFKISGPPTSIPGLNVGPFYYLYLVPAFWIGGGNPQFLVYFSIISFILAAIIAFLYFYKKSFYLGFFVSSIFLMSPQLFPITRYYWNGNSAVLFDVFYFLAFLNYLDKKDKKSAILWAITSALTIQFEAAFGAMCVAFSILVIFLSRKKAVIINFFAGLLPWFIPQAVYEIMHNFQMTKTFLGFAQGTTKIFGESLPITEVVKLHTATFAKNFEGQFMLPYGFGLYLLIFSIIFILFTKKYIKYLNWLLSFILFAFVFYTAIYQHELKPWYLYGLRVWYVFIVSMFFASLAEWKIPSKLEAFISKKNFAILIYGLLTIFLIRSFYLTVIDQKSYIADNGKSDDPKNAYNTIQAIDWIYGKANGEGFNAYNYVPEVHDLTDQYMYWYWGGKTFGYTPEKISYSLTTVPEYVRLGSRFTKKAKPAQSGKIALKYEKVGDYNSWLKQFEDYCTLDKKEFSWHVTVEWRERCN